jgi:2-polyprenyl-3-methyl-5-hydroxy-6-metoxy-1,4-benzoquinol methylase
MTETYTYDNSVPSPRFVAAIKDMPSGRVLDVGLGTAKEAIWLAENGWDVEGVEPSTDMYKIALERATSKGVHIQLHLTDLFSFHADKAYDLVVCQMVLHFFEDDDVARTIEKLKSLVAPGGRIYISVFSDKNTVMRPTMFHRGDLDVYFKDWHIEKSYEFETPPTVMPNDPAPTIFWFEYLLARKPGESE